MATSGQHLVLRLSLLLGFLAIAATARPGRYFHPCQTLIFFSTSTSHPLARNPNFPPQNPTLTLSERRSVTFFFTRSRNLDPKTFFLPSRPQIIVDRATIDEETRSLPFSFYPPAVASFRDRTKDILSVVGSLLLGIGCGGLTAATLFLIWSLFAPNRFDYRDYDDESDDDVGPKKMGYVPIPAADAPVKAVDTAPVKAVDTAPAKEVDTAPAKEVV